MCKELRNDFDFEFKINDLEEAKNYFYPDKNTEKEILNKEDYLGNDFDHFCTCFEEYKSAILNSENLENLAEVLNNYKDIFGNGSSYFVVNY